MATNTTSIRRRLGKALALSVVHYREFQNDASRLEFSIRKRHDVPTDLSTLRSRFKATKSRTRFPRDGASDDEQLLDNLSEQMRSQMDPFSGCGMVVLQRTLSGAAVRRTQSTMNAKHEYYCV